MVHSRARWRRPLPAWLIFVTVTASLGTSLLLLLGFGTPPVAREAAQPPPVRLPLPAGTYPEKPLAVGAKAPALAAAGWLNGAPAAYGAPGVRLLVLDIWAHW